jgi:hypothetical protein
MADVEAGRETDERIAVEVMGYRRLTAGEIARGIHANHRYYPTDIAAAWEVVEKMQGGGPFKSWWSAIETPGWPTGTDSKYTARVFEGSVCIANENADTAPLAICRAALAAISGHTDRGESKP